MLGNMSVTKMVVPDTDYTDGSSNGGGDNSNPSGGNDGTKVKILWDNSSARLKL